MPIQLSDSQLNKKIEFLNRISAFAVLLFRPGTEEMFSGDANKQRFKDMRFAWHDRVEKERLSLAKFLIDQLELNEVAFDDGISSLEAQIDQINNEVAFLQLLDKTLKLLVRIIAIA